MVAVIMGVAGAGKTTIGTMLAKRLRWCFIDADDFHPQENRDKMASGIALSDEDRIPWLESINSYLVFHCCDQSGCVVACSALKKRYRSIISRNSRTQFFCLSTKPQILQRRLEERTGHFFSPTLLQSQFDTLEISDDLTMIDCSQKPERIIERIVQSMT
ncbi:MAG: gluconokinase [Fibrobacterota bacterium]